MFKCLHQRTLKKITAVSVLTLSLFLFNTAIFAGDKIHGFKLSTCSTVNCIKLISQKATSSRIADGYAFSGAHFSVSDLNHKTILEFNALDVYYDLAGKRILFRDVQNMKFQQAYYDFNTNELTEL